MVFHVCPSEGHALHHKMGTGACAREIWQMKRAVCMADGDAHDSNRTCWRLHCPLGCGLEKSGSHAMVFLRGLRMQLAGSRNVFLFPGRTL